MRIQDKYIICGFMVFGFALAIASSAYADGYRNAPPTAEAKGKSGVNIAFVDDASAISFNPANLALQEDGSVVVAATFARLVNQYSPVAGVEYESDGDWVVLPNLYFSHPLGDSGVTFGLGLTTPYGQGVSWNKTDFEPSAAPSNTVPYDASVALININPTLAFKVCDSVSIGIGLDIFYSQLELKAVNGVFIPSPPAPSPTQLFFDVKGEGDGWGVGGNVGLTWLLSERQRVVFTYQSRVDVEYEGDFSAPFPNTGNFETTIKYPNSYGAGYGIQLTDDIRLEAMVEWIQWSVNDTQVADAGGSTLVVKNDWDDTIDIGIGGDWQLDENWVVRAGYKFLQTPVPASTITPLLPDADLHAFSLGVGYAAKAHTIDISYTFGIYDDVTGSNPQAPGTYDIDSDLVGLTYSYSF